MKPINEITKNRSVLILSSPWKCCSSLVRPFVRSISIEFSCGYAMSLMSTTKPHLCCVRLLSMILFCFLIFVIMANDSVNAFLLRIHCCVAKCFFASQIVQFGSQLVPCHTHTLGTTHHLPSPLLCNTLTFNNSNRSVRVAVIPSLSIFSSICNSSVFRIVRLRSCSNRKSYFDL